MDSFARLDEGLGSTHRLSLGGVPPIKLGQGEEGSLKKLVLRRIGKRQSQAIVNI